MRKVLFIVCILLAGTLLAIIPDSGRAAAPETVLQDDAVFLHRDPPAIRDALQRAVSLGFDRIRLTAGWSVIAPSPDSETVPTGFDGRDPAAYPAHAWTNLDRAVTLVTEAGLAPMIDIGFWAPRWATAAQDGPAGRARTDIDPTAYSAFAAAVARRYSGSYAPPAVVPPAPAAAPSTNPLAALLGGASGSPKPASKPAAAPVKPLPRVSLYTLWNEPNHPGFVLPQWRERDGVLVPDSPSRYRAMVQAAYPAVKAQAPDATVLIGGTSSMGSSIPGRSGVPPLRFLRELACVDAQLHPITSGDCAAFQPVPGDGWSHHPYSLHTDPDRLPSDPDLLPVARTGVLRDTLVALQRMGRLAGDRVADLYLTEYGYETTNPDPQAFATPEDQARLLSWAEMLGTSVPGVRMWPQFLLEDRPSGPAGPKLRPFGDWQTGLWYADGTPKPAASAFRTPTFAACVRQGAASWSTLWGRLRGAAPGTTAAVEVQVGSGWSPAPTSAAPGGPSATAPVSLAEDGSVTRSLPGTPAAMRLVWHQGTGEDVSGPGVRIQPCPRVVRRRATAPPRRARAARTRGHRRPVTRAHKKSRAVRRVRRPGPPHRRQGRR